jgi:long-chain-fatty-acid--CoA ligase ACSBG
MPTVKLILTFNKLTDDNNTDVSNQDELVNELINSIKKNNKQLNIMQYSIFVNSYIKNYTGEYTIEYNKTYPEDIATIIYTQEEPKGIVITHKNIMSTIKAGLKTIVSNSHITLNTQERYISYLPLNNIATQMMDIFMPMATIGTVWFASKNDVKCSLKNIIHEIKPTIFVGIPKIWEKIMEKIVLEKQDPKRILNQLFINRMILKEIGFDNIKMCITVSPVSSDLNNFFSELGIELCNIYGKQETSGLISLCIPGFSKGVGKPVLDIKIDKKTNEILVRGNQVFKEYYKNKKDTDIKFKKRWFKTGDTGRIDRDGTLYITGKITDTSHDNLS